jgi:hypothetical protein
MNMIRLAVRSPGTDCPQHCQHYTNPLQSAHPILRFLCFFYGLIPGHASQFAALSA